MEFFLQILGKSFFFKVVANSPQAKLNSQHALRNWLSSAILSDLIYKKMYNMH